MSSDVTDSAANGPLDAAAERVEDTFPEPISHGVGVVETVDDLAFPDAPTGQKGSLYDQALTYWRDNVGDPDREPHIAAWDFDPDWLPDERNFALRLTSSRWKAGQGEGDDYSAYYKYHLTLREVYRDGSGGAELSKPPIALHIMIMPQYPGMVYKDGNPLELNYGSGTRIQIQTTFADSGVEIERRAHSAIVEAFGSDAFRLQNLVEDSRRLMKLEAHSRFHRDAKNRVIDTIEDTKKLIAWGGNSQIEATQERQRAGWINCKLTSDRWDLLGFDDRAFSTELKVYEVEDAHQRDESDWMAHPKIEASFDGVDRGALPHVSDFDDILQHLRTVVATHCHWADVGREDMISDPKFAGPDAPVWRYERPTGRRELLFQRYQDRATDVYREALKDATAAPYDILFTIASHKGANYDFLEERTGLARSTIRYHVGRLCEQGVLARSGNPVRVFFISQELLEEASKILDGVRADEDHRDMEQRAEKRRERREELRKERNAAVEDDDDAGDEDASTSADGDATTEDVDGAESGDPCSDDDASSPDGTPDVDSDPVDELEANAHEIGFEALADVTATLTDVVLEYDHDMIDDEDIRIRVDSLPHYLR